jgi:hypothetical protein
MKTYLYKLSSLLLIALAVVACEIDEVTDPNNPSLASVENNASKAELQVLVTGLEARNREYFTNATEMFGSFAREVWPFFGSDPRFPSQWLGVGINETYPDFFASAGTYVNPYLAVKQANVLIGAAENSNNITEAERIGYQGFARTIKGFQLIWPLMQQYQNGIRVDVEDPLNPGPIQDYEQALTEIRSILDQGAQDLQNAGGSFSFNLSEGFSGFNTPQDMLKLNRAIAARAALYDEDFEAALTALEASFMTFSTQKEDMYIGAQLIYGEAPDINNPLFYPLDAETNTILIVHPALIEDAEEGDERVARKFYRRSEPVTNAGIKNAAGENLPGWYQDKRWESNVDPIHFIRNEELILIYAEAQLRKSSPNVEETVRAINTIRNTWGLSDYEGATNQAALMDEILHQRRYSLWAEGGHRWIDLRRTGRLNAEFIDLRDTGSIFTQVARRTSETNWEEKN